MFSRPGLRRVTLASGSLNDIRILPSILISWSLDSETVLPFPVECCARFVASGLPSFALSSPLFVLTPRDRRRRSFVGDEHFGVPAALLQHIGERTCTCVRVRARVRTYVNIFTRIKGNTPEESFFSPFQNSRSRFYVDAIFHSLIIVLR